MKLKHVLMIAAVLLSMMIMPVVAADDEEPALMTSGSSTLTLGVDTNYTVDIPETIDFKTGAYVTASDVTIDDGAALVVTVNSGYGWKLQLSDDNTADVLNYQMFIGGSTTAAVANAEVINIAHPATGDSVKLEFTTDDTAKKSGQYKDTLTFTIEVKAGAATEANSKILLINDLDGLKSFRDEVNSGNTYSGWTVKLMDDIDLSSEVDWTPIGITNGDNAGNEKPFAGTFDGQGHTISNLKIDGKDEGGLGLFGVVNGATFKNIILKNVDVKAYESEDTPENKSGETGYPNYIVGGHTGALVGYGTGNKQITFDNVHVTGLIKVEGETRVVQGQRVGGIIGGKDYSITIFTDVSVIGTEGSYIKGYCNVGGVAGQPQAKSVYSNVHTDVSVSAVTFGAGGIAGYAADESTFTSCTSAGQVSITGAKPLSTSKNYIYRIGGIAGCWGGGATDEITLTGCAYTGELVSVSTDNEKPTKFDCQGIVGRGYAVDSGSTVVIDGTKYVYTGCAETTGEGQFTVE